MEEKKLDTQPEKPQLVSLKDFVENYQKLIAVAGVFVALALFWRSIRPEESTPYISYLCLFITVPILLEVNRGYAYEKSTWTLVVFMQIFYGIILFTLYYLLTSYPNHLERLLRGLMFFAVFFGLLNVAQKIMGRLRQKDYNQRVQHAKEMRDKGLPIEQQQKLVDLQFKTSNIFHTIMDIAGAIAVFCLTLFVLALTEPYLTATFDEIFSRTPRIEAPKSNLELPKSTI